MADSKHSSRDFYGYFASAYPWGTAIMVVLMIVGGFAEGIGVLALIPVLELAEQGGGAPSSTLGKLIGTGLQYFGLQVSIGTLLLMIVFTITVKAIFLWQGQLRVGYMVAQVTRDLRLELMRALLDVRWRYFSTRTLGQFANAVGEETIRATAAYREACQVLAALIQILAYLVVAAAISWKIALGTILFGAVFTRLLKRLFDNARAAGVNQTKFARALSSRLIDVMQGIKPLKAMGRQELVWPLLRNDTESLNQAMRRGVEAGESLRAFQEPVVTLLLAGGLYVVLVISHQPFASVFVLAFVFYRIMQHIGTLQMRHQLMISGESAFFSLMEELESARADREQSQGQRVVTRLTKGIRLDAVRFAHGDRPVLVDATAFIPAGSFVAITGDSGSGKTTLADLIAGLYTANSGQILIDDVPFDQLDLAAWRSTIGYVPQEMLLLNDTIFRNVTLGDEGMSREDAEWALRKAGAWDFVVAKGGMDEPMGERGGMLSGGQRQRIAIARALVRRPSLLILDEVTTALDPATEAAICNTLRELSGDVTILSISHQRAMRDAADLAFMTHHGQLEMIATNAAHAG